MRLVDTISLRLAEFDEDNIPKYAILSHTWDEEEVLYADMDKESRTQKAGWSKIRKSAAIAQSQSLSYIWIDTCCIDKSSSAELSEAINSMYRWYNDAQICIAYLADVNCLDDLAAARWFRRGWTLQELLAPRMVTFYNMEWDLLGAKRKFLLPPCENLGPRISTITGIPVSVIRDGTGTMAFRTSVAERMSWASARETSRLEDRAYCLLGLFEINMPMIYGEGARAFVRLQEEIMKTTDDETIFAWSSSEEYWMLSTSTDALAKSPRDFAKCRTMTAAAKVERPDPFLMTNKGLSISSSLHIIGQPFENDHVFRIMTLVGSVPKRPDSCAGIMVMAHQDSPRIYGRVNPHIVFLISDELGRFKQENSRNFFIRREQRKDPAPEAKKRSRLYANTKLTFDVRDTSTWLAGLHRIQEWSTDTDTASLNFRRGIVKVIRYLAKDPPYNDCVLLIQHRMLGKLVCRLLRNDSGQDLKHFIDNPPEHPPGPPQNYLTLRVGARGDEYTLVANVGPWVWHAADMKSVMVDVVVVPGCVLGDDEVEGIAEVKRAATFSVEIPKRDLDVVRSPRRQSSQ